MLPTLIPVCLLESLPQVPMNILVKSLLFCWAGVSDLGLLSRAEKAWEFKSTLSAQASIRTHAETMRQTWDHRTSRHRRCGS